MATPATCQDSQDLTREVAERDAYGMDVDYELLTLRPQPNEEMLQIMQQMQQQLREQESCYQAMMSTQSTQINDLKQRIQTSNGHPQNQQNPPSMDDLMRWVQLNMNLIEKEEE